MKISQELRSQLETPQSKNVNRTTSQKDFQAMINKETTQMKQKELNALLEEITKQGEKIARFRSFRDLSKYKRLIKKFVKETVQFGMDLKSQRSFSTSGQNRKLSIIETIDEKLVELTDLLINQESESIDILGKIGEIKGLLINLYA
jgi:uncharacterized protein